MSVFMHRPASAAGDHRAKPLPKNSGSHSQAVIPDFILSEKQVLRFFGYFSEGVSHETEKNTFFSDTRREDDTAHHPRGQKIPLPSFLLPSGLLRCRHWYEYDRKGRKNFGSW